MGVGMRSVRRKWVHGFASSFSPLLFFVFSFFHLEHRSQPALAMPLAKSFASLPFAIVFLFSQSLTARVLNRAWSRHGHDGISAYGV